jgi:hypothetical protein
MPYDVYDPRVAEPSIPAPPGEDAAAPTALFEQVAREPRLSDKVADMML